jgi:hypothetical protein
MSCTDLFWRLAIALLTAFFLFADELSAADGRTLAARPVEGDIVLDGFLNEPAWDRVPAATGLTQREPVAGEPSTEPTEVRVAFTPATLYIGIRAFDSDPPGGAFTTNLFRERLQFNLTPDLATSAFVQFSDAAELLAANLRIGWTYKPGADIFLVFNQTWDAPTLGLRTERDRQAILKMTYLIAV